MKVAGDQYLSGVTKRGLSFFGGATTAGHDPILAGSKMAGPDYSHYEILERNTPSNYY